MTVPPSVLFLRVPQFVENVFYTFYVLFLHLDKLALQHNVFLLWGNNGVNRWTLAVWNRCKVGSVCKVWAKLIGIFCEIFYGRNVTCYSAWIRTKELKRKKYYSFTCFLYLTTGCLVANFWVLNQISCADCSAVGINFCNFPVIFANAWSSTSTICSKRECRVQCHRGTWEENWARD